jgi:hypothetical protein
MNPHATSFHPAAARPRSQEDVHNGEQQIAEMEQARDDMVIVFDDGSEGSEEDLPSPHSSAPRGLVNLNELRVIHRHAADPAAGEDQAAAAWWGQADQHLDQVHSVKDFWRVFSDDREAQGAMMTYNYMYPHGQHHQPTIDNKDSNDNDMKRRRREQQLHEVLGDVRRYIQTRMHPVQAAYLGSGPELFDEAGSGFNLQASLGPARTRGALCVFHWFHPEEVAGAMGQPISFTVLLGPPPLSPFSSASSPQRRGRQAASPPRLGSRGPTTAATTTAAASPGRRAAPTATTTPARRQRTASASGSPTPQERRQ